MPIRKNEILDTSALDKDLSQCSNTLALFQKYLKHGRNKLAEFHDRVSRAHLVVNLHAWLIDQLLIRAWQCYFKEGIIEKDVSLIAVGGYGRHELHPASDIDLLILCKKIPNENVGKCISQFHNFLWDMGLEVGHSVRTVKECVIQSKKDVTIATNMMESRLLYGDADLYEKLHNATAKNKLWSSRKFFIAKRKEQLHRHRKFDDATYNLEPNVKEGPGGLRDLQNIAWTTQHHFDARSLRELVLHGFLKKDEYRSLIRNRNFLWYVRNQLHYLAKRREDRLLFEYQISIAISLDYKDSNNSLAVEQFMKRYYRAIKELSLLNEILLQLFEEEILGSGRIKTKTINRRFNSVNGFIDVANDYVFARSPFALLEMFLLLEQDISLKGVRANTIRLMRLHIKLIDNDFRNNAACRSLFMEIMRQTNGVTHALRRMNKYGVLGAYLPVFGRIVGQMQHDLFHVLTVDEHTLFVVRNIRRFTIPEFSDEFPFASKLIKKIFKPERLYLAALFHDIAKGRGGNHSELGDDELRKFGAKHSLSEYDISFIAWLVRYHLIMSSTAQRKDINDPDVIREFAEIVGNQEKLNNLYLLTVADMRATSPNVWNTWKSQLLLQLYASTSQLFDIGLDADIDLHAQIAELKNGTLEILDNKPNNLEFSEELWSKTNDNYFLRYNAESLAWHVSIIQKNINHLPVVAARYQEESGGTELLIYTKDRTDLFIRITAAIASMALSIADARINTMGNGYALDTFIVLDHNDRPITDSDDLEKLQNMVAQHLCSDTKIQAISSSPTRRIKHFPIEIDVKFSVGKNNVTVMTIIAQDQSGLLFQVAMALKTCGINLSAAKISTYGERAEDTFFIGSSMDLSKPLTAEQLDCVNKEIKQKLNQGQKGKESIETML